MAINFSVNPDPAPLAGLAAGYSSNSFTYPLNLGAPGAGLDHYIIFNINENSLTNYTTASVNGYPVGDALGLPRINENFFADNAIGVATTSAQPISRVATTIAMYMPPEIQSSFQPVWDDSQELGAAEDIFGQGHSIGDAFKSLGISAIKNINEVIKQQLAGTDLGQAAGFATRSAINNHREVLFTGVAFREFEFRFMLVPQSPEEARNIKNIIQAFKFYAAPEIVPGTAGRFWLYPAEFDIQFVSHGTENLWINRISTCALTQIDVDYTPDGAWSALRQVDSNYYGSPGVSTMLRLRFKELEQMTKERMLDNY